MISYKPLEITLIEQDMKKHELYTKAGVSRSTFQHMMAGAHVSTQTLEKIINVLKVPVEKIVEITPDAE